MDTVRCAVWGSPVAHSLSPVLHATAYAELGLRQWEYAAVEVRAADLAAALERLDPSWRGLSLTMPLKRDVLPLLDVVSPVARAAGAANTVLLAEGRRTGDNTDVPGLVAAVRERWEAPIGRAVVLGGGATAASTLLGLADLGCEEAVLVVRDPSRAEATVRVAARRGAPMVRVVPLDRSAELADVPADLVVGTVPAAAQRPDLLAHLAHVRLVFEMVYDGWPTPLARSVLDDAGGGRVLVSALDLLVHQAVLQVALMTGTPPERAASLVEPMRAAGARALAARTGRPGQAR